MAEWLIERGIGETRAVRVRGDEILEARMLLEDIVPAGTVLVGRLVEAGVPAIVEANGLRYLLPKGAGGQAEGAAIRIEITRETIPGPEPWKKPLARLSEEEPRAAPQLDAQVLPFPSPHDQLERVGWSDLMEEARSGIVRFEGGELRISLTPAMTLIDVDGRLSPVELAVTAAAAAARAILRHGIGGSIGIDLPTIAGKEQRQKVGAAIDATLPQPFERTAMNGFGFIQIVRPRTRASIFELASDRARFEARAMLRRAAMERAGATKLVANPAVTRILEQNRAWLDALELQVGGQVTLRNEPTLPIHGAYAEKG